MRNEYFSLSHKKAFLQLIYQLEILQSTLEYTAREMDSDSTAALSAANQAVNQFKVITDLAGDDIICKSILEDKSLNNYLSWKSPRMTFPECSGCFWNYIGYRKNEIPSGLPEDMDRSSRNMYYVKEISQSGSCSCAFSLSRKQFVRWLDKPLENQEDIQTVARLAGFYKEYIQTKLKDNAFLFGPRSAVKSKVPKKLFSQIVRILGRL